MKSALSQLGPYRVEERIGTGGMATVYRAATGPEGAEARLALKVLHPELSDEPEHVEMFVAEGELAKLMVHPVLVPVWDTGIVDGTYYMAMDLLEGLTLSDLRRHYRSKQQPVPRGHALWIMAQVLDGLHFAHNLTHTDGTFANVVHR
ncbi:MAG: protein kinase, partial [Myxococcota bacterium]|nr:protein kinase [Myxococcota bacterium]